MTHLKIEFEEVCLPLSTESFQLNIRRHSPANKVPVLRDGELVIWDTMAIFEYLAEKYPRYPLWPEDLHARSYARAVCAEMHSGFESIRSCLPMNCRAKNRSLKLQQETLKEIARVQAIWKLCRSRWDHLGPWLMGNFSIVDAVFLPLLSRFVTYNIGLSKAGQAWGDMILATEAYQLWLEAAQEESHTILAYEIGVPVDESSLP